MAALSCHSSNVGPGDKISADTPAEELGSSDSLNPLLQIAQGGGEAPANAAEAMISVRNF